MQGGMQGLSFLDMVACWVADQRAWQTRHMQGSARVNLVLTWLRVGSLGGADQSTAQHSRADRQSGSGPSRSQQGGSGRRVGRGRWSIAIAVQSESDASRAAQIRFKQSRADQIKAGSDPMAGRSRSEHTKADQSVQKQTKAEQGRSEQTKADQSIPKQTKADQSGRPKHTEPSHPTPKPALRPSNNATLASTQRQFHRNHPLYPLHDITLPNPPSPAPSTAAPGSSIAHRHLLTPRCAAIGARGAS